MPPRSKSTKNNTQPAPSLQRQCTTYGAAPVKAPALKKGARVAIVAPASRPDGPHTVAAAVKLVEQMGFTPVLGKHVMSTHGYMAGKDDERLEDLNGFIRDHSVSGIFCATGGYGSLRLLDKIDYAALAANPKVVLGSDENTCLLEAINQKSGLICFHGFNLDRVKTQEDFDDFKRAVTSSKLLPPVETRPLFPRDFVFAPFPARASGTVIGGNLSAFFSLMGTRFQPQFENRILCFEDRNERSDILERWFTSLLLSGELHKTSAIIFGSFENCGVRNGYNLLSLEETLLERLERVRKPSCFNMLFGQTHNCRVTPIGIKAEVDTACGKLTFTEPALL